MSAEHSGQGTGVPTASRSPWAPAVGLHQGRAAANGATDADWQQHQLTENGVGDSIGSAAGAGAAGRWSVRWQESTAPLRRVFSPITGLGVLAMVAFSVCALIALVTDWQEFMVAAAAVAALLLIALLFLIGRSAYSVDVTLHSARVVAGQRATGALTIRNTGSRRLLPSRMELPVGVTVASFRVPSLPARAEHEELFVIPTARRAVLKVGPATSVRGDPLGLLRRQVRWTGADDLFVHPRTIALQGAATGAVKDLEGQPTRDLSSNDVSFHALRQYVAGDDRRYVHWRSSAKTGVLMVRQFEETRRTHLAVGLSTDPDEFASVADFELAVSAAASLGAQAILEERPVTVCAGPTMLRGESGRRLLDAFSALQATAGAGILVAGRRTAAAVPNASVAVLITGAGPDAVTIRRASTAFSVGIRVVAVRAVAGAKLRLSAIGRVDVATVGSLDDLPKALRRMRAA
ncbi:MAG: DUF58 domain-containing protein [Actinomycetota bacterium]|nr:DUF58 domain-containing protein [Actinomycetota bacterium]